MIKLDNVILKKYMTKPRFFYAVQWSSFGDHPEVKRTKYSPGGNDICPVCGLKYNNHGELKYLDGMPPVMVCSGDWIVHNVKLVLFGTLSNATFQAHYEEYNND